MNDLYGAFCSSDFFLSCSRPLNRCHEYSHIVFEFLSCSGLALLVHWKRYCFLCPLQWTKFIKVRYRKITEMAKKNLTAEGLPFVTLFGIDRRSGLNLQSLLILFLVCIFGEHNADILIHSTVGPTCIWQFLRRLETHRMNCIQYSWFLSSSELTCWTKMISVINCNFCSN